MRCLKTGSESSIARFDMKLYIFSTSYFVMAQEDAKQNANLGILGSSIDSRWYFLPLPLD
jgi:hypothetical protein